MRSLPAITQAAIKRQLAEEDAAALKAGTATVLHEKCSASGMVISGIELEEQQYVGRSHYVSTNTYHISRRRLKADVALLGDHATDIQRAKMLERQNLLRRRIDVWVQVQLLYMPGIAAQRARFLAASDDASLAYNFPLLLPSSATTLSDHALLNHEWRLRYAQAFDGLGDIRGHLEVRAHLYKFKDRFARGQHANTRSQTLIKAISAKIDSDADRYRAAYNAIKALAVPLVKTAWQTNLRPLLNVDIRHVTESEHAESEGRRKMSWIWSANASPNVPDATGKVQDSLTESMSAGAPYIAYGHLADLLYSPPCRVVQVSGARDALDRRGSAATGGDASNNGLS